MKRCRLMLPLFIAMFLIFAGTTTLYAEVGVTDSTVKIGSHMDLSGPIAFWGTSLMMGMKAYFNDVNDHGGVHGRKIDFIIEDDQYKPPLAVAAAKKLMSRDKIFAFVGPMGSQTSAATMKVAQANKVPFIMPLSAASMFYKPLKRSVFALFMSYYDQGKVLVDYALNTLKVKKIGMIYQEDELGLDTKKGVQEQLKKYNESLVISIPFKRGTKDFSSQVLKLRESGVDLVIIASVISEPASIVKEAAKLGWRPQFMCNSGTGANPFFLKLAGPASEGTIVANQALLPESSEPGVVIYRDILKKSFPKAAPSYTSQVGYVTAMVFVEALKISGRDLTREGVIDSMESVRNFLTGIYPPINFSSTNHQGTDSAFLAKVQGGKFVKITDFLRPK